MFAVGFFSRFSFWTLFLVVGMLTTVANDTSGTPQLFTHPWFQTWLMFVGEMLCLLGMFFLRIKQWRNTSDERLNTMNDEASVGLINSTEKEDDQPQPCFQWILILPTLCDLTGTTLAGIGLLYINASVWQMLRGSMVLFSGVLSVIFLDLKLAVNHYFGMFLVICGLFATGYSSFLKDHSHKKVNPEELIFGLVLTLLGIFVNSCQFIVEESFIKKRKLHPFHVVGMEGFFGCVIMAVAILPATYFVPLSNSTDMAHTIANSFHDNSIDAFVQLGNNYILLIFVLFYIISIAFFNFFGISITKELTAVHRTLIDATRTIVVWASQVFIYYVISNKYGEPWSSPASYLQLFGFSFLVTGTLVYNKSIPIPCFLLCDTIVGLFEKKSTNLAPVEGINEVMY